MAVDLAIIIEAVVLAQLDSFKEELTISQRKLIAHQSAMELARRIGMDQMTKSTSDGPIRRKPTKSQQTRIRVIR